MLLVTVWYTSVFDLILSLHPFVFEEPDGSSGDTLVACAATGAGCLGMQIHRHGSFSFRVNFVFVSPDGSSSPESFWPARARSVLFTLAGRVETGDVYRKPDTQEKGNTGENDGVHTRAYRPLCCAGEMWFILMLIQGWQPKGGRCEAGRCAQNASKKRKHC